MGILNRAFQKYVSNLFVSVVRYGDEWQIYSKVKKNGSILKKFSKVFPVENSEDEVVSKKIEEYIDSLYDEYNYVYVSYFLDSMGQGAIKGVSSADFSKHSVDPKSINPVHINKQWSVYASYIDIKWVKNRFQEIGIDFIYSSFVLIYHFLQDSNYSQKPTLYLLNHEDFITIAIFQEDVLLFGAFFKTSTDNNLVAGEEVENWEEEEEVSNVDEVISLEDSDSEDDGDFDSLEDLDDLDAIESDVSAEDSFSDVEDQEENTLGHFDDNEETLELYGRDMLIYKYLERSINEFYRNPLYESDFLEKIVFYDGFEMSTDLIDMVETELMLNIEIHKLNIGEVVCDISIKDAKV